MAFKDGVVLNFKYDNPVSNTIGSIMAHYWTHTGIVVKVQENDIYVLEALGTYREDKYKPSGFSLVFLSKIRTLFGGKVTVNKYPRSYLSKLHSENKLKVMDFKMKTDSEFADLVTHYNNKPYDYFGAFTIGLKRLLKFFGRNYQNDKNTLNKLFCSELAARFLHDLTDFDVLKLANKESFEEISPQDISLIYDKLKFFYLM